MSERQEGPERIWLQDQGDYGKAREAGADLTWCEDRINDKDTEYVRADLYTTLLADRDRLARENERLKALAGRYVNHVGEIEGTDFLHGERRKFPPLICPSEEWRRVEDARRERRLTDEEHQELIAYSEAQEMDARTAFGATEGGE